MADFPDIRRGSQMGDTSARQWQNLMQAVRAVAGMQVSDDFEFVQAGEVMHLSLAPTISQRQPMTRTVVLVGPFDPSSMVLTVREVRYRDTPPHIDPARIEYMWHEDVFQAYPEYGYKPVDYEPYFWDIEQDGVPDLSAVFFRARYERDLWIVDMSGAVRPDKLVVVRAFGNDEAGEPSEASKFLFVQEVRLTYDPEHKWTGEWEVTADEPVEVNVWPNTKAGDFAPFVWSPGLLNEYVTFLPLRFMLGAWWVVQQFKRPVSIRRGPLQLVDCQPVEE